MEALGRANALAAQHPSHFMLSRVLVRQKAVASSDIEGTHSTLDALLEVEETDDVDANEAIGERVLDRLAGCDLVPGNVRLLLPAQHR